MEQIIIALSQYGKAYVPGAKNNPDVLRYFTDIGHAEIHNDDTAWCSAFANWVAIKAGLPHSGSLAARSWLSVGQDVKVPALGDICVFWRISPTSGFGHVAFFIRDDGDSIWVLGGNQSSLGEVCIEKVSKSKLLGYRHIG